MKIICLSFLVGTIYSASADINKNYAKDYALCKAPTVNSRGNC